MTDTPFVYGVELKSPPPTTESGKLTQYDRFLKAKNMTEHLLLSAHLQPHHQQHLHHQAMDQTSSLLVNGDYYYTTPASSLGHDASNLTSSLGQILRHNIMAEWSLRGGSSAVTAATSGTTPHEAVVVAATGGTGPGGSSAAASRGSGDSTFQNNLIIPLYAIIFLLSVVGNLLVILTLAQNKRMRTVTNVYLLNLAISDLLLGVFCMPFTLVGQVLRKFIFGSIMCKLIPYFQAVSVSVAVWTLVAISLERYFAICRPLSSRRWQTQFHAYKMIALVWTLSFLVNSPLCYVQRLQPVQRLQVVSSNVTIVSQQQPSTLPPMKCREMWPDKSYERAYVLFLDTGLLCFPLLTMGFAYSMIVSKLWRGLRREIRHSTHQKHQMQIANSTPASMNTVEIPKLLPSRSQESSCYHLTGTPPILCSNINPNRISTGANNNYCYSSYGGNVLHYRGTGGAGMDPMGPTGYHGNASKQRSGVRFRMLKNFVESHRPKCSKPIIALNSATIISPSSPPSSLNCTGSQLKQMMPSTISAGGGKLNNLPTSSTMTTIATTTTPTSETALNDRMTPSAVTTPALVVGSRHRESSNSSTTTTTTTTAAGDKSLLTTVTTATALTSPDPAILPNTASFSRHAIRSNYMDKSIEAKKKVIRMLFVIIVEFFVCWAPLHILNTVYLYSPAFVYKYVSSNGIALVQLMAYISSCCNPITYCFMNRRFRQAFLNIFGCYRHRLFLCMCCCFRCGSDDTQLDAESKSGGSKANPSNPGGAGVGGNNSDISGNDSLAFAGRSIIQRSEIMVLESEDRV